MRYSGLCHRRWRGSDCYWILHTVHDCRLFNHGSGGGITPLVQSGHSHSDVVSLNEKTLQGYNIVG